MAGSAQDYYRLIASYCRLISDSNIVGVCQVDILFVSHLLLASCWLIVIEGSLLAHRSFRLVRNCRLAAGSLQAHCRLIDGVLSANCRLIAGLW